MHFLIYLIVLSCTQAKLIFTKVFIGEEVEWPQSLPSNSSFMVESRHAAQNISENTLPQLSITDTQGKVLVDTDGFWGKSEVQQIEFEGLSTITIKIKLFILPNITSKILRSPVKFTINIYENPLKPQPCQFPAFGLNCSQRLTLVPLGPHYVLTIKNQSWGYQYATLDRENYKVRIKNGPSQMALAVKIFKDANRTSFPTLEGATLIRPFDSQELDLKNEVGLGASIILGVFNFDWSIGILEYEIVPSASEEDELPIWAKILIILSSITVALAVITLGLYYGFQKTEPPTENKANVISKMGIERYMPKRMLDTGQRIMQCSICLGEITLGSVIRETPCLHIFHSGCLEEWLAKQVNCPNCRQSLHENDVILYFEKLKEENPQKLRTHQQGSSPLIYLTQTHRIITLENSPVALERLKRGRQELGEDEVVENNGAGR